MITRSVLRALPVVLAGWIGTLAAVMVLSDAAPGAVALFPGPDLVARMGEGAVVGQTRFSVTVRSSAPDLGLRLYRAGALLVLPAGLPGCLPLPGGPGA